MAEASSASDSKTSSPMHPQSNSTPTNTPKDASRTSSTGSTPAFRGLLSFRRGTKKSKSREPLPEEEDYDVTSRIGNLSRTPSTMEREDVLLSQGKINPANKIVAAKLERIRQLRSELKAKELEYQEIEAQETALLEVLTAADISLDAGRRSSINEQMRDTRASSVVSLTSIGTRGGSTRSAGFGQRSSTQTGIDKWQTKLSDHGMPDTLIASYGHDRRTVRITRSQPGEDLGLELRTLVLPIRDAMTRMPTYRTHACTFVASVAPESPAEAAKLQSGDCILELDGQSCANVREAQVKERLASNPGTVSMTVALTTDYKLGLAHRKKIEIEAELRLLMQRHDQLEVEEQQLQHRIDVKAGRVKPQEDPSDSEAEDAISRGAASPTAEEKVMDMLRERMHTAVTNLFSPLLPEACQSLEEARSVIVVLQSRWQESERQKDATIVKQAQQIRLLEHSTARARSQASRRDSRDELQLTNGDNEGHDASPKGADTGTYEVDFDDDLYPAHSYV